MEKRNGMIINSTEVTINAQPQTIADFLSDARNLVHLLPQDKISDFKADESECSFKVQGGVIISLVQNGRQENEKIFLKSGEKSPFPFILTININEENNGSKGNIDFDGEVNMFLKMMVEKPLTNLFNYMSEKLKEHYA